MVLVVVADVERHEIQRPIIIVGFLVRIEGEMLLDPTRAQGMQTADRKPERREEIKQRVPAEEIEDRQIEDGNDGGIDIRPLAPDRHRALQPSEPGELPEGEAEEPEGLAVPAIARDPCLEMAGQIGVEIIIAKMRMMLLVIAAKTHRRRESVRQVGEDRHPFVGSGIFEDRVVNRVMNDDEHRVIGEGADAIGRDQRRPPIAKAEMTEIARDGDLADDDGEGDDGGDRISDDQARDFRMRGQDGTAALRMRPHRLRDEKVVGNLFGRFVMFSTRYVHAQGSPSRPMIAPQRTHKLTSNEKAASCEGLGSTLETNQMDLSKAGDCSVFRRSCSGCLCR